MQQLKNIEKIADDIRTITIQGATNIAKAAFEILAQESKNQTFESVEQFVVFLRQGIELLRSARPTEPMLFNGMDYVESELKTFQKNGEKNLKKCQEIISQAATKYLEMINETAERAVLNGLGLIHDGDIVMTHCHSGSVVNTIILHKKKGLNFKVYNTETRPLFQGRKTSKALVEAGIDTTMITDSSLPFLMNEGIDGDDVDCVIIGCDAIKLDGSIINKVGSYSLGLAALYANVPVYVAGNLLKIDVNDKIYIEKRKSKEVWEDAPEGLNFVNLAFDQMPPKFVRGIITEFGYIKPRDIRSVVEKEYPWMKIHKK